MLHVLDKLSALDYSCIKRSAATAEQARNPNAARRVKLES